jgi:sigma-E factor negative regulatory protein RseA
MTDQIREQMSALLDGELAPGETGLLVRRMERDAELRRAFGNYVLAGESLRAPGGITASRGFAARVSAALDADEPQRPAAPVPVAASPVRWKRPLAGAAVAAGAALAAVLLVRPGPESDGMLAGATVTAPPLVVSLPAGGSSPTPAENQRLVGYLVAHGQYATPFGRRAAWSNALAADPGISRAVYEVAGAR